MRNFLWLVCNEGRKLLSRKAPLIMLAVLLAASVALCGIVSAARDRFDFDAQMERQIESLERSIQQVQQDEGKTEEQRRADIANYQARIDGYRAILDGGYSLLDWQAQLYLSMVDIDAQIQYIQLDPVFFGEGADPERQAGALGQIRLLEQQKETYLRMIEQDDWRPLVQAQLAQAELTADDSPQAALTAEICRLRLQYSIAPSFAGEWFTTSLGGALGGLPANLLDGVDGLLRATLGGGWKNQTLEKLESLKQQLIDADAAAASSDDLMAGLPSDDALTPEARSEIEEQIALCYARLEQDIPDPDAMLYTSVCTLLQPIMLAFAGVFILVVAGSMMSDEFTKGTIKFLLITPCRRYKSWLAKFVTILLTAAAFVLFSFLFTAAVSGLFFGFEGISGEVLAMQGDALRRTPFLLWLLGDFFRNALTILLVATVAYLLSNALRSSAAAIGISLAYYFVGGVAVTFIAQLNPELLENALMQCSLMLNLQNLLQPQQLLDVGVTLSSLRSAVTVGIYFVAVNALSMAAFCRRDIKL